MPIFLCNKLARDKTLQNFKESHITTTHRIVAGKELVEALNKKILEEAREVTETTDRKEIISELADILEVINGLCKAHAISHEEIEAVRTSIHNKRGGFENGLFLEAIEMAEDNPAVQHFRKSPERYIEIASK